MQYGEIIASDTRLPLPSPLTLSTLELANPQQVELQRLLVTCQDIAKFRATMVVCVHCFFVGRAG
jgi:hypothetical protein